MAKIPDHIRELTCPKCRHGSIAGDACCEVCHWDEILGPSRFERAYPDAPKPPDAPTEKHPGFCRRCLFRHSRNHCWQCILGRDGTPREFLQDPNTETETTEEAVAEYDGATFESALDTELDEIRAMLLAKNRAYGDSALNPVRVFSSASPVEQIRVRIDDKLSRLKRGSDAGEDVIGDMIGYLCLLRIATRRGES